MTPVPWKLWEGQVVDLCFPLLRYLGGTDHGAVYLTQYGDPEPRKAAIKIVLADSTESDPAALWDRASQLSHPNILRILRTGSWQMNRLPLRYALMEYAEENLADVVAERPLAPSEAREFLKPLLGALAYIHAEGLVHSRLKPANIMAIGDDLKLAVDGISLVGEAGSIPAPPGPYDPPEFRERGCSPLGDVWSFGVTLVEVLTQRLPSVVGSKQEIVLPTTLPVEFAPMVRACLQADPRRRTPVAGLLDLLESKSTRTAAIADAPAAPAAAGSRKWWNLAIMGAAAILLAGVFAGPRLLHHSVANAQVEQAERQVTPPPVSDKATTQVEAPRKNKPSPVSGPPIPGPAPQAPPPHETPSPRSPRGAERMADALPGQVVHEVMPEVPDYARRTIRGMVKIQVRAAVDGSGRVTDAKVEAQNSPYFAKLTMEAVRRWEFSAEPGDWLLRFEFTTGGTTVHPVRAAR